MRKPIFINEHGSWAMVFIPFLSAAFHASSFSAYSLLLLFSILFFFFSYRPLNMFLHAIFQKKQAAQIYYPLTWFLLYFSVAVSSGFALLLFTNAYYLLGFGTAILFIMAAGQFLASRFKADFLRDIISIIGVTGIAPVTCSFLDHQQSSTPFFLWVCNAAFFLSSAFYVHMKMLSAGKREGAKGRLYKFRLYANISFQILCLILLITALLASLITLLQFAGFIPILLHALIGSFIFPSQVSFKKIGLIFTVYSIIFLICISQ
ncbi:MAG: YwiC-like family protein [Ignavibacteriales bacterium]|nr:YwiC-like family protein [Ignavibacteriales bacterium]